MLFIEVVNYHSLSNSTHSKNLPNLRFIFDPSTSIQLNEISRYFISNLPIFSFAHQLNLDSQQYHFSYFT